jgi:glycosyltransferase involved in cell wall biosynthesis
MSKSRIAIISPFPSNHIGGITTYTTNLYRKFKEMEKEVVIIRKTKKSNSLFIVTAVFRLLIERPTIVHAHSKWYTLLPGVIYKAMAPSTIRVVFTLHTEPVDTHVGIKKRTLEGFISRCDSITFVSEHLLRKFEDFLRMDAEKRVICAAPMIKAVSTEDVEDFRDKNLTGEPGLIIVAISPLTWPDKVKGIKILIRSISLINEQIPDVRLIIVGEGHLKNELEEEIDKFDLSTNVILTGSMENVFIPLSIETVVATRTGGIPEAIKNGENGMLVEGNPENIYQAIMDLFTDKEKSDVLGNNAIKTIRERFTWEIISEQFLDVYGVS